MMQQDHRTKISGMPRPLAWHFEELYDQAGDLTQQVKSLKQQVEELKHQSEELKQQADRKQRPRPRRRRGHLSPPPKPLR